MENFSTAEFWIPVIDVEYVQSVLCRTVTASTTVTTTTPTTTAAVTKPSALIIMPILTRAQTCDELPTHYVTNKFTKPFQVFIEWYGVASYREMNPAPHTIVTIPFLFGIMFGDFRHSLLLALFAVWMIRWDFVDEMRTMRFFFSPSLAYAQFSFLQLLQIWSVIFGGH